MTNKGHTAAMLEEVEMDCPLCGRIHTLQKKKRTTKAKIKDEIVFYDEVYYTCELCAQGEENEYVPMGLMDENLLRARDAYRRQKDLLTSEEIAEIRRSYGMTQSEFAALLGWGEVTVTRYETKSIQDETYDKLMRMVQENPKFALDSLREHQDSFPERRYEELKTAIQEKIGEGGVPYLRRQEIQSQYIRYDRPSEANGLKLLHLDKVGAMMAFFANRFHYIYKVRLMKLLWYADALSFARTGQAISGLVYLHEQYGALPIGSRDLIYLPDVSVEEEEEEDRTKYRISSASDDFGSLTEMEMSILSDVFERFDGMSTDDIVKCMHSEEAYQKTNMHKIIPFSLCRQLNAFPTEV